MKRRTIICGMAVALSLWLLFLLGEWLSSGRAPAPTFAEVDSPAQPPQDTDQAAPPCLHATRDRRSLENKKSTSFVVYDSSGKQLTDYGVAPLPAFLADSDGFLANEPRVSSGFTKAPDGTLTATTAAIQALRCSPLVFYRSGCAPVILQETSAGNRHVITLQAGTSVGFEFVSTAGEPVNGVDIHLERRSRQEEPVEPGMALVTTYQVRSDFSGLANVNVLPRGRYRLKLTHSTMIPISGFDSRYIELSGHHKLTIEMTPVYGANVVVKGDVLDDYNYSPSGEGAFPSNDLSRESFTRIRDLCKQKSQSGHIFLCMPSFINFQDEHVVLSKEPPKSVTVDLKLWLRRVGKQVAKITMTPLAGGIRTQILDYTNHPAGTNRGTLTVQVYDPFGARIDGLEFLLRSSASEFMTLSSGKPLNVDAGSYLITCADYPVFKNCKPVEIKPGAVTNVTLQAGSRLYKCGFKVSPSRGLDHGLYCFVGKRDGTYLNVGQVGGKLHPGWLRPGCYVMRIGKSYNSKPIVEYEFQVKDVPRAGMGDLVFSF